MSETTPLKRSLLVYGLNAFLVLLTLFLAHRILAPGYERKENLSINKLGVFHTQLAAERMGAKLGNLREELKENGLRLVDPLRGPVALDSTRWLWIRIQDRDWRAPNFLDPLPAAQSKVDTWAISSAKNSFVISERIPIIKDGVQDFVLLEGGLKTNIFQDLQTDPSYGIWVFDMAAYEKGGLSAAKLFEKSSDTGPLSKDEIKLLTSDLLMMLFQDQKAITLEASTPWVLNFKNASGPSRMGVLGYWVPEAEPVNLSTIWISLTVALLILSGLFSFYILRSNADYERKVEEEVLGKTLPVVAQAASEAHAKKEEAASISSTMATKAFEGVFEWINKFVREMQISMQDVRDRTEAIDELMTQSAAPEAAAAQAHLKVAQMAIQKTFSILDRVDSYFGQADNHPEVFDVEIFFREFEQYNVDLPRTDSFFDPDLWRVRVDKSELGHLLRSFLVFLGKKASPEQRIHVSARYFERDGDDSGALEVKKARGFKVPFVRFSLHLATNNPIGRTQLHDLFALEKAKQEEDIEMALSQKVVERLDARLKVKSNFEDGNLIVLDIPAHESRKAEDKVNAKQFTANTPNPEDRFFSTKKYDLAEMRRQQNPDMELEGKTTVSVSDIQDPSAQQPADQPRNVPLAEIQKANAYAENISDERSRVRSRFRIRKPGEK